MSGSNVTAGSGLTKSGNTISIASGGVTSSHISNGTITDDDVASSFTGNEIDFGSTGSLHIPNDQVHSIDIDDGTIEGDDIGQIECDSSTTFVEVSGCGQIISDASKLPNCDEVPVGSMCEYDKTPTISRDPCGGSNSNLTTAANNCGSSPDDDVYIRTSW